MSENTENPVYAERLAELYGPDGGQPRRVTAQPAARRAQAGPSNLAIGKLTQRPDWHAIGTPELVAEAWQAVLDLAPRVREAGRAVGTLEGDESAEVCAVEAAVREGIETGKTPKAPKRTDWATERLTREATHRVLGEQLRAARSAYDAAVTAAHEQWSRDLAARLPELRAAAREAFAPAAEAFRTWRAAVDAATAVERDRDADRASTNTRYVTRSSAELLTNGSLAGAEALLASEHPVVTGSWIDGPDDVLPPRHVREAMADSQNTVQELAYIEGREQYRVTDFTRDGWEHLYGHVGEEQSTGGAWGWTA
jgi:hypothetical protein